MDASQENQKPRKGCLFYGCLTLAVLSLAVLAGGGIGLYFLYQKAEAFVSQYASEESVELPKVHYTGFDKEQFDERLRIFVDGLKEGKPTVPLVLRGEDINMLLAGSTDFKKLSEGVRLKTEGDKVQGRVSLKLEDLGAPFFKDRYLNGDVVLKVLLKEGRLIVSPSEILVNGKALPDDYMSAISEHNFAESANQNPVVVQTLEKLEAIQVGDGAVRIVPRSE